MVFRPEKTIGTISEMIRGALGAVMKQLPPIGPEEANSIMPLYIVDPKKLSEFEQYCSSSGPVGGDLLAVQVYYGVLDTHGVVLDI